MIDRLRRGTALLRAIIPPETAPSRVEVTGLLATYVTALACIAILGAVLLVRAPSDAVTWAIGVAITTAASYFSVRVVPGVEIVWTSSVFLHLALSWTFGPVGAIGAAAAQSSAVAFRTGHGFVRAVFNCANYFLSDLATWFVFTHIAGAHPSPILGVIAGTVAATVQCVVNYALLAEVIWIAAGRPTRYVSLFFRSFRSVIAYSVGYGWAAYGAVLLYNVAGTVGFSTTLTPVILLQGFLVLLARRIRAQEEERTAHAKERESLLQQAIDASDAERKRIASDLHDGVVQTLAGLAFSLAAKGAAQNQDEDLLHAADTLRSSVTDLRTLMIEIAPPDLAVGGVDAALKKLLAPLPAKGIEVELDAAAATHLPADKTSLVFRVAQEAIRNVVNHSQATRVTTRLLYSDGLVTLEVTDNGKGFTQDDRARRREEGHVGLSLLNNAVETASGKLSLTSEPGRGTSLMLELPCPQ